MVTAASGAGREVRGGVQASGLLCCDWKKSQAPLPRDLHQAVTWSRHEDIQTTDESGEETCMNRVVASW